MLDISIRDEIHMTPSSTFPCSCQTFRNPSTCGFIFKDGVLDFTTSDQVFGKKWHLLCRFLTIKCVLNQQVHHVGMVGSQTSFKLFKHIILGNQSCSQRRRVANLAITSILANQSSPGRSTKRIIDFSGGYGQSQSMCPSPSSPPQNWQGTSPLGPVQVKIHSILPRKNASK